MPLLDHFRKPLAHSRHWESFHGAWAYEIMGALNRSLLPPGYFAEAQVHIGSQVEVDVATFASEEGGHQEGNGGVAVQTWAPSATALTMPAVFPDDIEVQVFQTSGGTSLVAALELISPANKGRPETRRAFAAKCAAYLQRGVGLAIVDVVTERQANLHDELLDLLEKPDSFSFPDQDSLYAVAYRPARKETGDQIEIWLFPLALGEDLPTVPLALLGGPTLPLDLEIPYKEACARSRL